MVLVLSFIYFCLLFNVQITRSFAPLAAKFARTSPRYSVTSTARPVVCTKLERCLQRNP